VPVTLYFQRTPDRLVTSGRSFLKIKGDVPTHISLDSTGFPVPPFLVWYEALAFKRKGQVISLPPLQFPVSWAADHPVRENITKISLVMPVLYREDIPRVYSPLLRGFKSPLTVY
jgi:hypothetical protein